MMTNLVLVIAIWLTTPWTPPPEVRGDTGDLDWMLYSRTTGEPVSGRYHPTLEACQEDEQSNLPFAYRYQCLRQMDPIQPLDEKEYTK
jgi:hypothetical protein